MRPGFGMVRRVLAITVFTPFLSWGQLPYPLFTDVPSYDPYYNHVNLMCGNA